MLSMLLVISGGRNVNDIVQVWGLTACTMMHGLLCEYHSRPDPLSAGERWVGQTSDNRVRNWLARCVPHFLGIIPHGKRVDTCPATPGAPGVSVHRRRIPPLSGRYSFAWFIIFRLYLTTLGDVDEAFGDRVSDELPGYIIGAVVSTFVIFSSFTIAQLVYQFRAPKYYWQSELVYCALSATSKIVLGSILLVRRSATPTHATRAFTPTLR